MCVYMYRHAGLVEVRVWVCTGTCDRVGAQGVPGWGGETILLAGSEYETAFVTKKKKDTKTIMIILIIMIIIMCIYIYIYMS